MLIIAIPIVIGKITDRQNSENKSVNKNIKIYYDFISMILLYIYLWGSI